MKVEWRLLVAVALGGALGSVARFMMYAAVQSRVSGSFPIGTLLINILGSLVLGFVMQLSLDSNVLSPAVRIFLTVGFCGGFTTFSTFSYETLSLIREMEFAAAGAYASASVLLSVAAVFVGMRAAHR